MDYIPPEHQLTNLFTKALGSTNHSAMRSVSLTATIDLRSNNEALEEENFHEYVILWRISHNHMYQGHALVSIKVYSYFNAFSVLNSGVVEQNRANKGPCSYIVYIKLQPVVKNTDDPCLL